MGGDYPLNATELSILSVILGRLTDAQFCKQSAAILLSRIDFGQISGKDLNHLLDSIKNENILAMLREKSTYCDRLTDFRDRQGLLNLRGMQLSVVKVIEKRSLKNTVYTLIKVVLY